MPVHDWSRVDAATFHSFRAAWVTHLKEFLNSGLLPKGYFALSEQVIGPQHRSRRITVRHENGRVVVAVIEIVSPDNKDRQNRTAEFSEQVVRLLREDLQVLLVDLFPPCRNEPAGIHATVWSHFDSASRAEPAAVPPLLASYVRQPELSAYLEPLVVGQPLSLMPLFLDQERYISVPLEQTYAAAYRGMPEIVRRVIEGTDQP